MSRSKSPRQIEQESFEIIDGLVDLTKFSPPEKMIVQRVIHASGDLEFVDSLVISPGAVEAGLAAMKRGATIVTDVNMVRAGISKKFSARFGCECVCRISEDATEHHADVTGTTRAAAAIERSTAELDGGIAAFGNAPTALFKLNDLYRKDNVKPALVVGVPVGFVGAEESKDELASLDLPHITNKGRKGGSAVAVAVINALLLMAAEGV